VALKKRRPMTLSFREFNREQLLEEEYDPLSDISHPYYSTKWGYGGERILCPPPDDHTAALRGIYGLYKVPEGGHFWEWFFFWGGLHDDGFREKNAVTRCARYRNQLHMVPRIEFERRSGVRMALIRLLEVTPLKAEDVINIKTPGGFYMTILEALRRRL